MMTLNFVSSGEISKTNCSKSEEAKRKPHSIEWGCLLFQSAPSIAICFSSFNTKRLT